MTTPGISAYVDLDCQQKRVRRSDLCREKESLKLYIREDKSGLPAVSKYLGVKHRFMHSSISDEDEKVG